VIQHRNVVKELAKRDVADMHAGQAGGLLWVVVHPITMLVVYGWLFTTVFKVRIADGGPSDYLLYLFAGLAPWLLTQGVISRATQIMIGNATIVKKVMFPPEALVAKSLLSSLRIDSILIFLTAATAILVRGNAPLSMLLLVPLGAMHGLLLWGMALALSILTPYFRDLSEFVRLFLLVNIYLIPIMYLPAMVPEGLRFILAVNPFSHLIWCYQDVFYFNTVAHPISWIVVACLAAATTVAGSYVFIRLRGHVANVL